MIQYCRFKPNTKVKIACNSGEQLSQMADVMHTKLEQGDKFSWAEGYIRFANGSKIECAIGGNGLSCESMWFDEAVS
jgi:hypothetical protein